MTEEQKMIQEFIKENGVTKLPPDVRIILNSALAWKKENQGLAVPEEKLPKKRRRNKKKKK